MFSKLFSLSRFFDSVRVALQIILRWIGVLFGLFPKAGRLSFITYRIIHYVFIISATLVLAYYSPRLIPANVESSSPFVRRFYLGIMFFLFYVFVRLLIAAINLLLARDTSEFADIDEAFDNGIEALAREGYDLQWLPVFLICGATHEQLVSLFESCRLTWKVGLSGDVLSFFACDEALFIGLDDVGAMSRQLKQRASEPVKGSVVNRGVAASDNPYQATIRPGQIQQSLERAKPHDSPGNPGATLKPGAVAAAVTRMPVSDQIGSTLLPGAVANAVATSEPRRPTAAGKLSQEELRVHRRRLAYFFQRLSLERGSYCPLNGLLQVVPLKWSQSVAYEPLFGAAKEDLQTIHDQSHLQFPVVVLHSGLEEITGLTAFVERLKEINPRLRDSRAGSQYPAGLAIDEKSSHWIVEKGLAWFRDWIYEAFAKNLGSPSNRQLYQLLCGLFDRRERMATELKTIFGDVRVRNPIRLSGCYFSATGSDGSRQAFVQDVMQRLMQLQNNVSWNSEWRAKNRRRLWLAAFVGLLAISFMAADGYLVWQIWEQVASNNS